MKIKLTENALRWFKDEIEAKNGDYIRFYARYGGTSPFHEGFSLGMNREEPHDLGIEVIFEGIHFYVEKNDLWFFNDHDLHVDVKYNTDELIYNYSKSEK